MGLKQTSEKSLAVFIDFENLALGFLGRNDRFDIRLVLKRLLEKGKIVAKKAYADWNRFSSFTGSLHEAAIELVEIPRRGQSGKNSADIRLCVDAMDLAYSKEHIDTFVIVSGDSDFSPLVSKLKELGKHVIGLGMSTSTSNLLRDNCDEFIYYEDLTQDVSIDQVIHTDLPDTKRKAFMLLLNAATALRRDNKEILHPSQIKATMQRMKPSFNESYHGYRTFSAMLEDAQKEGLLILDTDKRSGTYVVTQFGAEIAGATSPRSPTFMPSPAQVTQRLSESTPSVPKASDASVLASVEPGSTIKPVRNKRRRGGRGRKRPHAEPTSAIQIQGENDATDTQQTPPLETLEHPIVDSISEVNTPAAVIPDDSNLEPTGEVPGAENLSLQKKRHPRGGRGRSRRPKPQNDQNTAPEKPGESKDE